jgi:hypothetical protein
MKTTAKSLTSYGNCTLVQLEVRPESEFSFKPGGPEIRNGGLIISESAGGVVGKLVAVNNTASFLLLTDADVLTGAKQNRVLNRPVLLAPFSKTMLDVSCIERGRWHYTTQNFSSPSAAADPDLRKSKAASVSDYLFHIAEESQTQHIVWSKIASKMHEDSFSSDTENYSDLVSHKAAKQKSAFPLFEPESGCNGLAVLTAGKITCVDIFGTAESYLHYFPGLRDAAFLQSVPGKREKETDIHEASYRTLEFLDHFELSEKTADTGYTGAGSLFLRDSISVVGFELECSGQLIHCGIFGK